MKRLALISLFSAAACATTPTPGPKLEKQTGHVEVNGLKMYYEVHGKKNASGIPLVLIHGGGSSIDVTFSKTLPFFSETREVIAVDEQAHGRSGDRPGPVSFEATADDVAALLKHMKVSKADILGFSNGASSALQVAIRHPELVRKLVFVSSLTKRSGAQPGLFKSIEGGTLETMPQPLKDAFLQVNPDPAKLKNMFDKDSARMRTFKDVPDAVVKSVKVPTLIVMGDQDVARVEHGVELSKLISKSRLLVLPGGHGDFLGEISSAHGDSKMPRATVDIISQFLD